MRGKSEKTIFVITGIIIIILVVGVVLLARQGKQMGGEDSVDQSTPASSEENLLSGQNQGLSLSSEKYLDEICKISFSYPKNWIKSDLKLPLPQEPLSQVTFNEPQSGDKLPKNSIFSFICYDGQKYSFDQFLEQNPFSQGQTESLETGGVKWQRVGNFFHATKDDKLFIFEMFFTKYDLKPEAGYEETFLEIMRTIRFSSEP